MASQSNHSRSAHGEENVGANGLLPSTVDFESLRQYADYVTSEHNPENLKGIETVAVELPLPCLRRGLPVC